MDFWKARFYHCMEWFFKNLPNIAYRFKGILTDVE